MHTLMLKLVPNRNQRRLLNKSFYLAYKIYVITAKYARKKLNALSKNQRYIYLKHMYGVYLTQNNRVKLKMIKDELNRIIEPYDISVYDLEKYIKIQQKKYRHYISSQQAQKIAKFITNGIDKVLYSNGKRLHIKKYNDFCTISQKTLTNGVKFFNDHINFMGLDIPVKYSKNVKDMAYVKESLKSNLVYSELKRIEFNTGYDYYVNLVLRDDAPDKIKIGKDTLGIDPGVSIIASVSDEQCVLEELAPKCKEYDKQIEKLNKQISQSMLKTNPDCINSNSTYKKGCRLKFSKHCKYLKRKVRVLYRQKSAYTKCMHNNLANRLLNGTSKVNIEEMDFNSLAKKSKNTEKKDTSTVIDGKEVFKYKRKKRFGKSINDRSPGLFVKILKEKSEKYGITLNEVNTRKVKASQYNHLTNECEKHKLSERTKLIGNDLVQRDLYSAYLIKNVKNDLETLDKTKIKKDFDKFLAMQETCIKDIKQKGIKNKNFGF